MRTRFLLALLAACGGGGGELALDPCGPNGECPAGFVCNPADNLCYAEGTIRFDAGLPSVLETEIVTKPPARTRELRAELTFTGGPSFRCQLDGQVIDPCTSPFVGDVSEGAHRFEVAAMDGKGTSDPTPASHSWEVDRTGPTVTLTGPSEGSTTGPNVSFMFTSEAGATFRCSFDADSRNRPPCPGNQASATLAAGGHRFSVTAFDDLGNAGEPAARSFLRDLGIGSHISTNDPPIPGRLPFTTRETYRFVDAP